MTLHQGFRFLLFGFVFLALAEGLAAQQARPARETLALSPTFTARLFGTVYGPDGQLAEGAVVVSSAGGRAITKKGRYVLELELPLVAERIQVTAVGQGATGPAASTSVPLDPAHPGTPVDVLQLSHGTTCVPSWMPTFGPIPGIDGSVSALCVFDDGDGPALYAGGSFAAAGSATAASIAKWDGSTWTPLGAGLLGSGRPGIVNALAVYDDGGGPDLYAAGDFVLAGGVSANHIARWDGSTWSPLGVGLSEPAFSLAVFDAGTGAELYVGGSFSIAGGASAPHIARWDGAAWSSAGTLNNAVLALAVFDAGTGPALYAGGSLFVGGSRLARLVGCCSWSPVGTSMDGQVEALAVYDDGGGDDLYVGGRFTTVGGLSIRKLARWSGTGWSSVVGIGSASSEVVRCLSVADDGGGPALFIGGSFDFTPGLRNGVVRWDGSTTTLGSEDTGEVFALTPFDDGDGTRVFAGGIFSNLYEAPALRIGAWDGTSWQGLGEGVAGPVSASCVFDDGSGPALYVVGPSGAGGQLGRVLRWDGSAWTSVGDTSLPFLSDICVFDDGSGPALHAFGSSLYRWDGGTWTLLATTTSGVGRCLEVFDDGGGPDLYLGGSFFTVGGVSAHYVARWNGTSITTLGSGMNNAVLDLRVHDDGGGPDLYAIGDFITAGGVSTNRVARWNGSAWSTLSTGLSSSGNTLCSIDLGAGPVLVAGGSFNTAGGTPASKIAFWDGTSWNPLGSGLDDAAATTVGFDPGNGFGLFVGGYFETAGGLAVQHIAKWDGSAWSALGSGTTGPVTGTMTPFVDGGGPALFVGGSFASAPDSLDGYLAKWGCDSIPPVLTCPPGLQVIDQGGTASGETVVFAVTAVDGIDPAPVVVCTPPSGSLFPRGTTLVTCTATDASGNSAMCQFTVTVKVNASEPPGPSTP